MSAKEVFTDGIVKNNPTFIQLIGLCSVLAVSVTSKGAFGMGISLLLVLTASNVVISLLRKFIPSDIRIPAFIVVVASFVTILQMVLEAFVPSLYKALGIFLPLIVVNCIILGRAEAFAYKNTVGLSLVDGLGNGVGYTLAITAISIVRELFGAGTFFGNQILPKQYSIPFFQQPASAFIILGLGIAIANFNINKKKEAALNEEVAPKPLKSAEQAVEGGRA